MRFMKKKEKKIFPFFAPILPWISEKEKKKKMRAGKNIIEKKNARGEKTAQKKKKKNARAEIWTIILFRRSNTVARGL
jgi:hypothetical protein